MIYILIPTYNEENNIPFLYEHLKKLDLEDVVFFVFSDDGSTDKTISLIEKYFQNKNYIVLSNERNYGPGRAFNRGFEWIINHSKNTQDIILTMEADCTSDVTLAPKMIKICQLNYDMVLASVYAQGGGFDKTTFLRKILSFTANFMLRFVFDIKVLTLSSFYRCYKVELIKNIKKRYNDIIKEKGFICMIEILLKAISLNAQIIEVPMVLYSERRKGKSKMKKLKTIFEYILFLIQNLRTYKKFKKKN